MVGGPLTGASMIGRERAAAQAERELLGA
jgi:hypothetical protein